LIWMNAYLLTCISHSLPPVPHLTTTCTRNHHLYT
jgi:hypothetical protein